MMLTTNILMEKYIYKRSFLIMSNEFKWSKAVCDSTADALNALDTPKIV